MIYDFLNILQNLYFCVIICWIFLYQFFNNPMFFKQKCIDVLPMVINIAKKIMYNVRILILLLDLLVPLIINAQYLCQIKSQRLVIFLFFSLITTKSFIYYKKMLHSSIKDIVKKIYLELFNFLAIMLAQIVNLSVSQNIKQLKK